MLFTRKFAVRIKKGFINYFRKIVHLYVKVHYFQDSRTNQSIIAVGILTILFHIIRFESFFEFYELEITRPVSTYPNAIAVKVFRDGQISNRIFYLLDYTWS